MLTAPVFSIVGFTLQVHAQLNPANILVIDADKRTTPGGSGFTEFGALFRVDPATGSRTVVSDFGGLLSTVTTPAGQTFRCSTLRIPETGASIKCEAPGNKS